MMPLNCFKKNCKKRVLYGAALLFLGGISLVSLFVFSILWITDLNNDHSPSVNVWPKITGSDFMAPRAPINTPPKKIPKDVTWDGNLFYRSDNPRWTLDIAYPNSSDNENKLRPGLVFVHGGGWYLGDKGSGKEFITEAAGNGYVSISVNYRLIGEAPFPAQVEDVKCAIRWFRANANKYQLDPNRIGAFGESAGGYLVAMLGLAGREAGLEGDGPYQEFSSEVQAVCSVVPPSDFRNYYVYGFLAGPYKTRKDRIRKASPVLYANRNAPPFLIIHGQNDQIVPFEQGKALYDSLVEAGASDVTFLDLPGSHAVFRENFDITKPAVANFFARVLSYQSKNTNESFY